MKLQQVVVVGAGTMGSGIAQWFAMQLIPVVLSDTYEPQLAKAQASFHANLAKLVEKGKLTQVKQQAIKDSLTVCNMQSLPSSATLVIEAVVEEISIKNHLFQQLDKHFSKETIFASNTSSFSIEKLSLAVSSDRRKRFIGLHFFNPATIMKLVEIVQASPHSKSIILELTQWFQAHGKEPALCQDRPGFIVNRVARSFYGEPLRIVNEENLQLEKEIDEVFREVGQFKMGPFELMDLIGIDINYAVTCSVWDSFNQNPRFSPHPLQKKLVEQKRFGKKTKKGFYSYE
jgi:3-hydroxybutyryl-CoA dehydrogenase